MAIKLHPGFAVHPGAWLRAEMIEPHGLSVTDAAANAFLIGDQYGVVAQGDKDRKQQINIWLITRAGLEVVSLLPPTDERFALREAAQWIQKVGINKIVLGRSIKNRSQVTVVPQEIIWENSEDIVES
ncbi:MAG: hypothetical protein ABIR08_09320 [Sphingomonas sp.]